MEMQGNYDILHQVY